MYLLQKNSWKNVESCIEIELEILSFEVFLNTQYLEFNFYITFQHLFMNFSVVNTQRFDVKISLVGLQNGKCPQKALRPF